MLDKSAPWAQRVHDSSYGLSPASLDKVRAMQASNKVKFVAENADNITSTEVVTKSHHFKLEHPAFDATGFDMR